MIYKYALTLLLSTFLLFACTPTQQPPISGQTTESVEQRTTAGRAADEQPIKSDNDSRQYRYLTLPNQLRVLLISDPETDKSAASLDVHVGAGADPKELEGLAHFLEHMLFLGTEKYPEAGAYQDFISAHGGRHNAYTSFEHTNYFFDIDPDYLDEALDRFAQFFIAPLFTERYVDREKNAVHSEFMAKLKDDSRRGLDVLKTLTNPEHPFAKFTVGNLDTLVSLQPGVSLRDRLLAFYEREYSANIMTLVVLGQESLDELEQQVAATFKAVPNRNKSIARIEEPLFSEDHFDLPLMINIKPEKKRRSLSLAFPVADTMPHYRQKPLYYLGNILGHEGKNSLLSWLKERGWAEGLSAGSGFSYRGGSVFNLQIALSPKGVEQIDSIVAAVFQTIDVIRESPDQGWLYEEQQRLAEQSFLYQERAAPMRYVMGLSAAMHEYASEDILRGPYLLENYDEDLITQYLDGLRPENVAVTLTAPEVETEQRTTLYDTPYRVQKPTAKRLALWRSAEWRSADQAAPITLPAANPYIAENLALKTQDYSSAEKTLMRSAAPKLIRNEDGLRLWYKPDGDFEVPRGSLFIKVNSPLVTDSIEGQVLLRLYAALVADQLNEPAYPASLAGLSFSLPTDDYGLSVLINGYSDKQLQLLEDILKTLRTSRFDQQRFDNIKREQIRALQNAVKDKPYERGFSQLATLLHRHRYTEDELLAVYENIVMADVQAFGNQFLANTDLEILVHGNYFQEEAVAFGDMAREVLQSKPAATPTEDISRLDHQQYSYPLANGGHSDVGVMFYLQGQDLSKTTRAAMGLTAQILRASFYHQLRTQKQLGYIVTSGAYPVRDVPGLFFLVQSPVADRQTLQNEIIGFIKQQLAELDAMTEDDFLRHRAALLTRLREQPKNLWEQSNDFWREIQERYYNFDMKTQLIAAIEAMNFAQWKQLCRQHLGDLEPAVWVYTETAANDQSKAQAQDEASPQGGRLIEDLSRFKSQIRFYQFP